MTILYTVIEKEEKKPTRRRGVCVRAREADVVVRKHARRGRLSFEQCEHALGDGGASHAHVHGHKRESLRRIGRLSGTGMA